ncbi:MAG TPA: ABC transporter permease [Candidatus Aminicenantes bacterium]|nr:ABC transporter permease [Candidatus Aminicenantes bacterium]HRY64655.1 ABC transporter permease [Candidatus Aminicenantes bacterium]HRZ71568.1 ABC transporter permease [Candidatus Aminicenantes bacterium]
MRPADAVDFALASLRQRRLRTFLTASGVMIGIGALVSMISFGKGLQKNVTRAFEASDLFTTVTVLPGGAEKPGGDPDGKPRAKAPGRADALLDDAAVAALARLPGVAMAYPDVSFPALVGLGDRREFRLVQVVPAAAVNSSALRIRWGRAYGSDDENGVVVNRTVLRQLGETEPAAAVGRTIRITTVSIDLARLATLNLASIFSGASSPVSQETAEFPIVGVTEVMAFGGEGGLAESAVMIPPGPAGRIKRLPFSSVWDLFRIRDGRIGYSAATVRLASLRDLDRVRSKVQDLGFGTFALADQLEEVTRAFRFMDMALAAVGMIAIVVAALGIVNTMIMSILERYREIGVMKAVGASDGDIKRIFFFESGAIGLAGGAAGCVLGWATSLLINRLIDLYLSRQGMPHVAYFSFPAWIFLGAVAFAVLVSLASGIYPARRAARVDPVVALRHD